jgi:ribose transport system substrate-binding protein
MTIPRRTALFLPALLAACSGTRKRRIAVIPKATSHLFWVSVQAGALAAGKRFNVEILWNGPATETDYSRQIQILDSMVAQRVDGIALAAAERKALIGPVERATGAGIPVTVFDSGLDTDKYMSYVGTDNVEAGRLGARKLAESLGGKGVVAVVMHAPGSVSTMDREAGFREVLAKEFPNIRLAGEQFCMSDRARARAVTENLLSANPDIRGFFCSTEPAATGAVLAIRSRELVGKLKFVSVDASPNLVDEMKAGLITAIVAQDPFGMALQAVQTLVDKLNGKTPPRRIDLKPQVITAADLSRPEIQQLLNPT